MNPFPYTSGNFIVMSKLKSGRQSHCAAVSRRCGGARRGQMETVTAEWHCYGATPHQSGIYRGDKKKVDNVSTTKNFREAMRLI